MPALPGRGMDPRGGGAMRRADPTSPPGDQEPRSGGTEPVRVWSAKSPSAACGLRPARHLAGRGEGVGDRADWACRLGLRCAKSDGPLALLERCRGLSGPQFVSRCSRGNARTLGCARRLEPAAALAGSPRRGPPNRRAIGDTRQRLEGTGGHRRRTCPPRQQSPCASPTGASQP